MITTSIVNLSPTSEFTAAENLSGGELTAVSLTKNGVITAGLSAIPVGILTGCELPIEAGELVTAQTFGNSLWQVGGQSIRAGDFLAAGDGGRAVKASAGQYIFARALENASASAAVPVQIVNAGKL